jgi:hypothetical protein
MCFVFAFVYPFSFSPSFEGVKVEATGKEKIEYLMVFCIVSSSHQESLHLKRSEMAAV